MAMANIFSYIKCGGENSPGPFSKKSKLRISLDQQIKVFKYLSFKVFIVFPSRVLSKYIGTKVQTTSFIPTYSFLEKQKEVWNLSLCLIFCMIFKEKYFSRYIILSTYQISLCLIAFNSWAIALYVYWNCLFSTLWRNKFWNQPSLPYQNLFLHYQKSQHKNLNIFRTKKTFKMK